MNRNVKIILSGLHSGPEEDGQQAGKPADPTDRLETVVTGEYFFRGGSHYLLYEELDGDTGQMTKSRIKIREDRVEITRQGLADTHMVFEKGVRHRTDYRTPYGIFALETDTAELKLQMDEERIRILLAYRLEADGAFLSACRMEIAAMNI